MHGAHIPSSTIADTMVLIAICTGSRALLELAIALRALTTGSICVPPGPENAEMVHRIARSLLDPQWMTRTRAALGDTRVEQLAGHFYNACLTWVPTNAEAPLSDETWLHGVRALYSTQQSLQYVAGALINQFAPVRSDEPATQSTMPPAPAVAAVSVPATTSTSSAPSPAEVQAKLIARLEKIAKLYRFLKLWKAHQARMAAIHSSKPNPAPVAIAAPEVNSTRAPENAPSSTHIPAVQFQGPWAMTKAERASVPSNVIVFPAERLFYRPVVDPVGTLGQFVDAQRGACGLSPP